MRSPLFFERPDAGEQAILVHVYLDGYSEEQENLAEFTELVVSAGANPAYILTSKRHQPSPRYFIGDGKLEELQALVAEHSAEIVLFNHSLSPAQERNLEKVLECRVLDRTGLILDIFAQRARSYEGKLQVELAQLQHLSTRLVRGWTHLDRQKGGIGLRGAGETQLEMDQRMLRGRIKVINKQLLKVRSQRQQSRRGRKRADVNTISLVGYTNAGKSTLFNRVSQAGVYVADQLFATLDSTLRRIHIPNYGTLVLADTVGFIRHLPHKLVEAFRATLEETCEAGLLLHVVDAADGDRQQNIAEVQTVLKEIGAEDIACLEVFNKIDLLPGSEPRLERDELGVPIRVWLSAQNDQGMDILSVAISELLGGEMIEKQLSLTPAQGRFRSHLYSQGAVVSESIAENGEWVLNICLAKNELIRLLRKEGMQTEQYI